MTELLRIAQVTPYAWESGHEVNVLVDRVSAQLRERGHQVVAVAPARDGEHVRRSRQRIRSGGDPFGTEVLAVGEVLAELPGGGRRRPGMPVDVARTVEELLTDHSFDVVHVHEPFAPSVASVAQRHSRSLNVGTFHAPTERVLSTQLARKVVERVFGRLDARLASYGATADLMSRHFPGEYTVVLPGADAAEGYHGTSSERVRIVFVDDEERPALRLFLRALRGMDDDLAWEATVVSARGPSSSTPLRADLRERVRFVAPSEHDEVGTADVVVAASDGALPAPGVVIRALASGAVPVCSSLAVYEELLAEGERGLLFAAGEPQTLTHRLDRLVRDADLRARLAGAAAPLRAELRWERVATQYEEAYERLVARRHPTEGNPDLAKVRRRKRIDIDLHMHTDHSWDCATPVEHLLATAKAQGLGAIAVTDHNEVSGAIEAQAKAEEYGVKVILGEEVKTAHQGEVIGLFIQEKIPKGLTLQETVAEIKRQNGVVYVPHPFDRMHSVPDYEHLLDIIDDIDAIEIYNPRVAIGSFNEEAERFAAKYRILAAAGSDAHVAAGLGSVRVRVPDFDGPEEFLEALRDAEILTKRSSLLYVQALKFLETKATPPAARRAVRRRRVRRASRKG